MTPETFTARWKDNKPTERTGVQSHLDDLCDRPPEMSDDEILHRRLKPNLERAA